MEGHPAIKTGATITSMKRVEYDKVNNVNGATAHESSGAAFGRVSRGANQIVRQRKPRKPTYTQLKLGTWNVGTLRGKLGEIAYILARMRVSICCLQETRYKGSGARIIGKYGERYKIFWSGSKDGYAGVGVMVSEEHLKSIVSVDRVNERLMMIKLVIGNRLTNVVSLYAPQVGREKDLKDAFWEEVFDKVSNIPSEEGIFMAGDTNGHVGRDRKGYERIHGGHSYGRVNEGGERMLEICEALDLAVCNTYFHKKEEHMVTYVSGDTKSTLDYILCRRSDVGMVTDIRTWQEEYGKQHKLVIGSVKCRIFKKKEATCQPRLKLWRLRDEDVAGSFCTRLNAMQEGLETSEDVDGRWRAGRDCLTKAAGEICGHTRGKPRHKETWWWNEEVRELVDRKRRLWKIWKTKRTEETRQEYCQARKATKKAVAEAKKIKAKEFADELDSDEGRRNVFRVARQMAKDRQDVISNNCMLNEKGELTTDSEGIKEIWKKYMEKLLNEENEWDKAVESEDNAGEVEWITREEITKALSKMRKGKAPGQSLVVTEMMDAAGEWAVDWLTELCNEIIKEKRIPEDWCKSIIVPVYKGKGSPLECGSYRAIKLLEHAMKVMEKVLECRIRQQVRIDDMQFGFTPGKGTTDAIFIVRRIQEKFREKGRNLYYAFIDLEKAYDRVPREVVRWALRKAGVKEWLVETVMAMYEGARTAVRTEGGLSDWFSVRVGLHQGSGLSPLLFIIVMDVISREVRGGLPWELLYADDIVLMATSLEELKEKLLRWKVKMESKGMKVNVNKTKIMVCQSGAQKVYREPNVKFPCGVCGKGVGSNSIWCETCKCWVHKRCSGIAGSLLKVKDFKCKRCRNPMELRDDTTANYEVRDGMVVEKVDRFCYLGDMLSADGGAEDAMATRIRIAWNKFRELGPVLMAKCVSLQVKGKVYVACVRSTMLYGSETWAMTEVMKQRLERTEMRMVRMMCGVTRKHRLRSLDLRSRLGIKSIVEAVRRHRLRWYGHVMRKPMSDHVRSCLEMEVDGHKKRGRPRKTWLSTVNEDMKIMKLNKEDALVKTKWRGLLSG